MERIEERRRFVRLNALVDVVYTKRDLEEGKPSVTKNISKGGICLIVYEKLEESDFLDLKIYLPEDKAPVSCLGRVVWTKEFIIGDASRGKRFDAGIEFIDIDDKDLARIDQYVFTHLNK